MGEPKFAYKVDECDASYTAKYNLVRHLRAHHNVVMELSNPKCPSIWEESSRVQDHVAMNARVLSNPLALFHHNEQNAIAKVRRHAFVEWDIGSKLIYNTHLKC